MEAKDVCIKLGEYDDGSGFIEWHPFVEGHEKLVLIGQDPKMSGLFDDIEKQITGLEEVSYFKINSSIEKRLENEGTLSVVTTFERNVPAAEIKNNLLSNQRVTLVNLFIQLMETQIGLVRKGLRVGYRPTIEGPLYGYIRAVEEVEEQIRVEFNKQIEELDNVTWGNENNLFLHNGNPKKPNDELLHLLKGIWSFWVFAMDTPAELPKIVHLELPDTSSYANEQLDVLDKLIEILEQLSFIGNIPLLLTTNRVSHILKRSIRYKLFTKNVGEDYDYNNTSIGFEETDKSFVLIDDVDRNKYVGDLIY